MLKKILKKKSVVNSFIYIFTDILNKSIPFLLLPVLTKYLSPSDYGMVAIFISFTALLAVLIGLSTQNAIYVNYFKYTQEKMKVYISNIILLIISSTLVILSIIFLFKNSISQFTEIPLLWLFFAVLYIFTKTLSSILNIIWMVETKAILFGLYQIFNTIFLFTLILIFVISYELTWVGQLSAMLITSSLFAVISIIILLKKNYIEFAYDKDSIIDALKFGVPLIPYQAGEWLKINANKFLLVFIIGTTATGLYAVGYQIASIVMIVSISIQKAWQPYFFKQLEHMGSLKDKLRIVKLTYIIFLFICVFALFIYLISPYIISIFLDKKFENVEVFIGYLIVANMFAAMSNVIVGYIYYTKKTGELGKITIVTALLHVCLSYILIVSNGPIGAAQASSISFFITFFIIWYKSNQLYQMPWNLFTNRNQMDKKL